MTRQDECHAESTRQSVADKDRSSHDAEQQVAVLKSEVDSLRCQLAERDSHITTIEDLQLHLKKQLSARVAEISVSCCLTCL